MMPKYEATMKAYHPVTLNVGTQIVHSVNILYSSMVLTVQHFIKLSATPQTVNNENLIETNANHYRLRGIGITTIFHNTSHSEITLHYHTYNFRRRLSY